MTVNTDQIGTIFYFTISLYHFHQSYQKSSQNSLLYLILYCEGKFRKNCKKTSHFEDLYLSNILDKRKMMT